MEKDIRVERTQTALRNAFCEMLASKPAYGISVTNLTKKAGVSRVTFYIHYKDIADFIEKTCDWALEEMIWPPASEMNIFNIDNAKLIFTKQAEAISKNAGLFRALFGNNGPNYFLEKIVNVIEAEYHIQFRKMKDKFKSKQQIQDTVKYLTAGELAILIDWIHQDHMESIDAVVEKIMILSYKGVLTSLGLIDD